MSEEQTASEEQTTSKGTSTQDGKAGVFRMGNSPSLRWGNQVRIDLHARVQADVSLQEESDAASDRLGWGNRRIGVDGVLFKRVEFQIEREFSDVEPWRDVFADVRMHRALRVRAGHFKVPFSMERTTSDFDLDFIARAASVTDISPGRETGIMLHGRGPRRFFDAEVGVFRLAEPPLKPLVESGTDGAMLTAARFTLRPAPRASESRSQGAVFPRAFMAYPATSTTMACCPPRASMSTAADGGWESRADGQPGGSRSKANFSARLIHERVNPSRTAICRISSSTADTSAVRGALSGPHDGRDDRWMWPPDLSVSASTAPLNSMHPPSVRAPITSHRYVRMRGRSAAPGW